MSELNELSELNMDLVTELVIRISALEQAVIKSKLITEAQLAEEIIIVMQKFQDTLKQSLENADSVEKQ